MEATVYTTANRKISWLHNMITARVPLKSNNNFLCAPHFHIHILCPQHWLNQADEKSSDTLIFYCHKGHSTP